MSNHVVAPTSEPGAGVASRGRDCGAWLGFALALPPLLMLVHKFWFVIDDAFISFRYARNLAGGHGLRYNLTENPPVEGYSNFLWTLVCAAYERLGLDMTFWPPLTGTLCGVALLALVARRIRALEIRGPAAVLAVLSLGCFPPFAVWCSTGLEAMAFALLVFLTFDRLVLAPDRPDAIGGGCCAVLLAMVRVEGVAWCVVIFALATLSRAVAGQWRASAVRLLVAAAIFAALFGVYFAWRYAYFDTLIANTALAKGGFLWSRLPRGLAYVGSFWLTFLTPVLIVPGALLAFRKPRRAVGLAVAAMALAFPAYAIAVTGDFMPMGRFLLPGLPFAAILTGWLLTDLASLGRAVGSLLCVAFGLVVVALGVMPAFNVHVAPRSALESLRFRFNTPKFMTEVEQWADQRDNAANWSATGRALRAYVAARRPDEPNPSIVMGAIGAAGYYSNLHVYDRHGLVTPRVARRPVDEREPILSAGHDKRVPAEFFLDDRPTILEYRLLQRGGPRAAIEAARAAAQSLRQDARRVPALDRYVVDVFVPSDDRESCLIVTVRLPEGQPTEQAWAEFQRRLSELAGR